MRIPTLLFALMIASVLAFAQCPSGNKCSAADKKAGGCCSVMAATAAYSDARMMPDCAPQPMHDFHRVLMPFIEARHNVEPSYVRDNARFLYNAAQPVPKSKACCKGFDMKTYRGSANDLVKDCALLQKLSADKATKDDAVLAQMKIVEDDFVKLSNCCE